MMLATQSETFYWTCNQPLLAQNAYAQIDPPQQADPSPRQAIYPNQHEHVCNHLVVKKKSQKQYFDRAHNAKLMTQLDPGQEVLFLSPADQSYIPGTIVDMASTPQNYHIEAQGKCYCRTQEHI